MQKSKQDVAIYPLDKLTKKKIDLEEISEIPKTDSSYDEIPSEMGKTKELFPRYLAGDKLFFNLFRHF